MPYWWRSPQVEVVTFAESTFNLLYLTNESFINFERVRIRINGSRVKDSSRHRREQGHWTGNR